MKEKAFINEIDIWTWGARLEKGAYEALLTPVTLKPHVENKSRLINGTEVLVDNPKVEERTVSFVITMRLLPPKEGEDTGGSEAERARKEKERFLNQYGLLVAELMKGEVVLRIPALNNTNFKLIYESCTKFGNYGLKAGKFSLRFREPNPADRPVGEQTKSDNEDK